MTRFQIVGIFNDTIYTTTEFNGDGYFSGYGHEVCERFLKAKTFEDYKRIVEEVNESFGYEEKLIYDNVKASEFDFLKNKADYYNIWFSDYLYIKNFTDKDFEVVDDEGTKITIQPDGYVTLYFGTFCNEEYENINSVEKCKIKAFEVLTAKAESLDWNIDEGDDDDEYIELSRCTPLGEDFSFAIEKRDWKNDLKNYVNDFDVDDHVRVWVNYTQHSIRDLLEDAEWIESELIKLKEEVFK